MSKSLGKSNNAFYDLILNAIMEITTLLGKERKNDDKKVSYNIEHPSFFV